MQLDVRFIGMEREPAVIEFLERQLGFTLGRFSSRIGRVVVRLEDVNGPRGGRDKVCRIEARGDFGERVSESIGTNPYSVSARAMDVLERSIARALKRERPNARRIVRHG